jgi:hypothetical protein
MSIVVPAECILWCLHVYCGACMYIVVPACLLWCLHAYCGACRMYIVVPACLLWCLQNVYCGTCRMSIVVPAWTEVCRSVSHWNASWMFHCEYLLLIQSIKIKFSVKVIHVFFINVSTECDSNICSYMNVSMKCDINICSVYECQHGMWQQYMFRIWMPV